MSFTTITCEVDPLTFTSGIFMSSADLISPVSIQAEPTYPQSLQEALKAPEDHPGRWSSCAAVAGIAQNSLRNKPAGVLARFDIHYRNADTDEMNYDFQNFGEQVMGPRVSEVPEGERDKWENNNIFNPFGDQDAFYFIGPPRVVKSMFLTRVFPGELPESLDSLVADLKAIQKSNEDPMVTPQCYQFFHATDGKLLYSPFVLSKTNEYNPTQLNPHGHVEISDQRMTYFTGDDRRPGIDFTENLYRE